jgi:hypothetical protein
VLDPVELAYARLTKETRDRLVARYFPGQLATERFGDISGGGSQKHLLYDALEIILALGDENALEFVESALRKLGWTSSQFRDSFGRHERAAQLFLSDEDQARQIARWWNGNALVRSNERSDGFETPDVEPNLANDEARERRLKELIEVTLKDHFASPDIVEFLVSTRPSPWPEDDRADLIQIDIKRGGGPERVEIEEGGRCVWVSLNFVSTLVVLLDPGRGTIHVGSENKKRELRADLARTVLQHFYGRSDTPAALSPLGVHPEKLRSKPDFGSDAGGLIVGARVSELWYLRAPQYQFKAAVISDNFDHDIYRATELNTDDLNIEPYRARIQLRFRTGRPGEPPARRTATLLHPNSVSFPHFTPAQQFAAEKFLIQQELIDPNYKRAVQNSLAVLDSMEGPANALRLERSLGSRWRSALQKIKALVPGPPSDHAFCASCLSEHTIEDAWTGTPPTTKMRCHIDEEVTVEASAVETLVLRLGPLARWTAQALTTEAPSESGWRGFMWDFGPIREEASGSVFRICLAHGVGRDGRLAEISRRLAHSGGGPGLVLSFSDKFVGTKLDAGWTVALFTDVVSLNQGELFTSASAAQRVLAGEAAEPHEQRRTKEDWAAVVAAYQGIRRPGLGHYPAAKELHSISAAARKWGERRLADKLKESFPVDFC